MSPCRSPSTAVPRLPAPDSAGMGREQPDLCPAAFFCADPRAPRHRRPLQLLRAAMNILFVREQEGDEPPLTAPHLLVWASPAPGPVAAPARPAFLRPNRTTPSTGPPPPGAQIHVALSGPKSSESVRSVRIRSTTLVRLRWFVYFTDSFFFQAVSQKENLVLLKIKSAQTTQQSKMQENPRTEILKVLAMLTKMYPQQCPCGWSCAMFRYAVEVLGAPRPCL